MKWEPFVCEGCRAVFEHPDVRNQAGEEEDCESIDGKCAHLVSAGWMEVWKKVTIQNREDRRRDLHIFSAGGWICPACVARYLPRSLPARSAR